MAGSAVFFREQMFRERRERVERNEGKYKQEKVLAKSPERGESPLPESCRSQPHETDGHAV